MTDQADRWRRVEQLCVAALERAGVERAAFLRDACGDDEALRHEVEQLLGQESEGEGFLNLSVGAVAAAVMSSTASSLTGRRINALEVGALIGAGGMGEVYRARDTELKRDVALKVLPASLAGDAERLARFRREAEVLASLNHPHIAAIYGLERSAGITALVMELVEGPTLDELIAGSRPQPGGIPLDEALPIAKQIADALEAAHERGIIHRDLKPANIKVRADGVVKVLDFGLAKAMDPPSVHTPTATRSPTITSPAMMTGVGVILGTAAYMSPEQARGKTVDKRADIWAFGCLVYEMLTGQRAFGGDDVVETLANVINREPAWEALPAAVPTHVRQTLRLCLKKLIRERVPDIGAVRLGLEGAFEPEMPRGLVNAGPFQPLWRRALPVMAAVVLTAALAGGVARSLLPGPAAPGPVARFQVALPNGQTFAMVRQQVVISPDGTRMAYVANRALYIRAIDDVESHAIPGMPPNLFPNTPVFAPDGQSIAFFVNADSSLRRIPVGGGQPLIIARDVTSMGGMSWGEAGIVFGQAGGVFRVSPNGGVPEQLAAIGPGETAYGPQVLPGGKSVMFTLATGTGADRWDTAQIVVQSLTSGERRTIIHGGSDARYLPTGHIIYALAGTMFAVAFDLDSQTVRGEAVAVVAGVRRSDGGATAAAQLSVSNSGSLFFVPGPLVPSIAGALSVPTIVHRNEGPKPLLAAKPYVRPRVSRDGGQLAVGIDDGIDADVWVYDLSGKSALRRLTSEGHNRFPVWFPDGQRVTFQSDREGTASIYAQASDGVRAAVRLTEAAQGVSHVPDSWSPDGQTLLFSEQKGGTFSLMALSVGDKRALPFGGVQSTEPPEAVFSPDGQWVAYSVNQGFGGVQSSDRGIFVQPFPATGARYPVPKTVLDFHPAWGRSSREIFYVSTIAAADLTTVSMQTQPSVTFTDPVAAAGLSQPGTSSSGRRAYDVLPDGRFISLLPADNALSGGVPSEMRVVLNWTEELKRLVPVR